ncbi:sigma-54-dependent Fis family transcriptional regulator [Burkholderia sp. PU8-34]
MVDESWRRCLDLSVDPAARGAPPPVDEHRLLDLLEENNTLIQASQPLIKQARECLSQTGTILLLTDREGTIIESAGDAHMLEPLGEVGLIPGCNWSEFSSGTNAIGTALSLNGPVQIHGAEHFCEGVKRWTCSAAAIHDPLDASLLGVIDISGLAKTYSKHTLALIVSLTAQIENRLAIMAAERRYRLLERCITRLSRADPVAVVDELGRLVKANAQASATLARLGGPARLEQAFPVPDVAAVAEGRTSEHTPEWLRRVQIETVKDGTGTLGYVISMPHASRPSLDLGDALRDAARTGGAFSRIVGNSEALRESLQKARQLARTAVPVLLYGETGVGKELFAQGIHQASDRADGPFVALNCGSLSRDLLTSELFGYAEGAFTGARKTGMPGKIESAHRGTLFLDEIGEMPPDIQPHLLRVLESGELYRLGESTPRKVDFRLIAATHRDLRTAVADGSFRMDLYYRIAVTSIAIPPLRERVGDLPLLIDHWLGVVCDRHGMERPVIDEAAWQCLLGYAWPGNVRELRNAIEGAALIARDRTIVMSDLPVEMAARRQVEAPGTDARPHGSPPSASAQPCSLEDAEIQSIRAAMRQNKGNVTRAAQQFGIAKSTLYEKFRKHGLMEELGLSRSRPND